MNKQNKMSISELKGLSKQPTMQDNRPGAPASSTPIMGTAPSSKAGSGTNTCMYSTGNVAGGSKSGNGGSGKRGLSKAQTTTEDDY